MAKKGAIKFPNHNTTHATLIPREKQSLLKQINNQFFFLIMWYEPIISV
jgi:hypothetical protein